MDKEDEKTLSMRLATLLSWLVLALCLSGNALGMTLEEAKNQLETVKTEGQVGETQSGYLKVVGSNGQAREVVEVINEARRKEYARIAQKHDIPVTQVETVAGQKAIEKTPPGQFVEIDGQWKRK